MGQYPVLSLCCITPSMNYHLCVRCFLLCKTVRLKEVNEHLQRIKRLTVFMFTIFLPPQHLYNRLYLLLYTLAIESSNFLKFLPWSLILKFYWHQPFLLLDCHDRTILKLIFMTSTIFNTNVMGKIKGRGTSYTNVLGFFFCHHAWENLFGYQMASIFFYCFSLSSKGAGTHPSCLFIMFFNLE